MFKNRIKFVDFALISINIEILIYHIEYTKSMISKITNK